MCDQPYNSTQLNCLGCITQSDYSILDKPFCAIFTVWLCPDKLIKTIQSLYVTGPLVCDG